MKQFFVLFFFFFFYACDNGNKSLNEEEIDYYQFQNLNLSSFDIPATIFLPDASAGIGTSFKPSIEHEVGDYKWKLKVGRYFIINIEDYGDFKYLYEEKRKQILYNKVYTTKIVKEENSILVYQQCLNEEIGKVSNNPYYIYAVIKLDDVYYQITNNENGNTKEEIDFMLQSIKSIKKIN